MEKVRALFDWGMADFPESMNRLSANPAILSRPLSVPANGVQHVSANTLTHEKRLAVSNFVLFSEELVEDAADLL